MLEALAILTLLFVGAIVIGVFVLLAGILKMVFKLALLPMVLGLKALVFVIGFVIALRGGRPGGPAGRRAASDSAPHPRRHRLGRVARQNLSSSPES